MKHKLRILCMMVAVVMAFMFAMTSFAASNSATKSGVTGNVSRTTTTASANSSCSGNAYVKLYVKVKNTSTGITETLLKGENSGSGYASTSCRAASYETFSLATSYHGISKNTLYFDISA